MIKKNNKKQPVISLKNVSKVYTLHHEKPTFVETIGVPYANGIAKVRAEIDRQLNKNKSMEVLGKYDKINASPVPKDQPFFYDDSVYAGPTYYYKVKLIICVF